GHHSDPRRWQDPGLARRRVYRLLSHPHIFPCRRQRSPFPQRSATRASIRSEVSDFALMVVLSHSHVVCSVRANISTPHTAQFVSFVTAVVAHFAPTRGSCL